MRSILIAPLIVPLLTIVPVKIHTLLGGVLYAHGPSANFFLLGAAMSACVFAWECFAIPFVIIRAQKNHRPLKKTDLFCIMLAGAYVLLIAFLALVLRR